MGRKKGSKNKSIVVRSEAPVSSSLYKVTFKIVGRTFKAEGKTLEEALGKIKISGGAKAISVLTVEKDGIEKERILNGRHTHGIFGQGSPTMKAIHLKQILLMFDI